MIRCDASPTLGLGHVVRCIALARVLRDEHGCRVTFAMRDEALGHRLVQEARFPYVLLDATAVSDYSGSLAEALSSSGADLLVVDVRDELTRGDLAGVRERCGARVAVIDDGSERRLAADHAFYPPVPQAKSLDWTGFAGNAHIGWEWVLLRPEFADEPVHRPRSRPSVLVSMGGTDPQGLTPRVVRALGLAAGPLSCTVLAGLGGADETAVSLLDEAPEGVSHDCTVVRGGDVRAEMLESDLAVLAFGVTAYEAAACALPAVHIPLDADHTSSSSVFSDAGIAVTLAQAERVEERQIADSIDALLADATGMEAMGAQARRLVDGGGASRIAEVLVGV